MAKMHLSSGITLAVAVSAQAISIPLAPRDSQPQSRASMWKPAVGTTWQIVLKHPLTINPQSPAVEPSHVDVYDIDLFDNTKNGTDGSTIAALHSLGKKVICYFSAGTYEGWRPDAGDFKAADKGNRMNNWNETWLNINSPDIRDVMAKRIKIAADVGCDAIDPDNVDGYVSFVSFYHIYLTCLTRHSSRPQSTTKARPRSASTRPPPPVLSSSCPPRRPSTKCRRG